MRKSDEVLYITLVDFLVQLIFLGLIVGVVYAISKSLESKPIEAPKPVPQVGQVETILRLTGISDISELTDELTRLGPLRPAIENAVLGSKLSESVHRAGGTDSAIRIIQEHLLKRQGSASCLPDERIVAKFHAFDDRIELQGEISADFKALLEKVGASAEKVRRLSFAEFQALFKPLGSIHPNCRFNVSVVEYSPFSAPRDAIASSFWIKARSRANP